MVKKLKICIIASLVIGLILLIIGLVLGFAIFPPEVEKQIKDNVILKNGTEQWDRFVDLPIPLTFKVYIFQVDNKDGVLAGEKPNLSEQGPYVYKQHRKKESVEFTSDSENYVQYREIQKFEFDQEASGKLKDTDEIQALNTPYIATLQISEGLSATLPFDFETEILPAMFPQPNTFIKTTVKALLLDGIRFCDPLKGNLGSRIYCLVVTLLKLKNISSQKDGSKLFSYLDFKNNKDNGLWEVDTGASDYAQLGEIQQWEHSKYTNYWVGGESTCNKVEGRDSTIYPPLIEKDQVFTIFSLDICRKVKMSYLSESTYKDIAGYRFESDAEMLNSDDPEKSCYCLKKTKDENGEDSCFMDGVLDLYSCYGAPILASCPHFLFASDKYLKMVNGLKPKKDAHVSYCDIEPNTGTPLNGVKRIQFNLVIRKYTIGGKDITETSKVKGAVIPAIWVEEGVALTDEYIEKLNVMYFDIVVILEASKWSLIAIGIALTVLSLGLTIYKCKSG